MTSFLKRSGAVNTSARPVPWTSTSVPSAPSWVPAAATSAPSAAWATAWRSANDPAHFQVHLPCRPGGAHRRGGGHHGRAVQLFQRPPAQAAGHADQSDGPGRHRRGRGIPGGAGGYRRPYHPHRCGRQCPL